MAWATVVVIAPGCGSYVSTAVKIRTQTAAGNIDGALKLLEEEADDDDVLNLMERGLLLFYAGRHEESAQLLLLADARIEDLYTRSVSREALAFLTNDATLPYSGYPHEQVMLNTYLALNYVALDDLESALVACRRVGLRLSQMETLRQQKQGYTDDGFAQWMAGMLFAQDGDANAAMVSARRAEEAYAEAQRIWGYPPPTRLVADHILWGRRFGFVEEAETLAVAHPEAAANAVPLRPDEGEVLLLYESGYVSLLDEVRVSFPIFESDFGGDHEEVAPRIYARGPRSEYVVPDGVKIKYWLDIALPVMVPATPRLQFARLVMADQVAETEVVQNVSAIAQLTFEEGAARRAIRTIVRALAKYLTVREVKKRDEFLGWIANITGSATERADTRSWALLPDRIHMARLRLPAGRYPAVVEVLDEQGAVAQTASFEEVQVVPGELTVIHHRSYR